MIYNYLAHYNSLFFLLLLILVLWTIPWRGVALWKAARNSHKKWFIILLIVNTLAILEIIYIFAFSKKKTEGVSNKVSETRGQTPDS